VFAEVFHPEHEIKKDKKFKRKILSNLLCSIVSLLRLRMSQDKVLVVENDLDVDQYDQDD